MNVEMNKRFNINYIEDGNFTRIIHRYGIGVVGSFIVGNDDDTTETFDRIFEYVNKMHIDVPTISFLIPFPGTLLENRMKKEKRLENRQIPGDWSYYNVGNRALIDTNKLTRSQLNRDMKRIIEKLFRVKAILKRFAYSLVYTFRPLLSIVILKGNLSYRDRHFHSSYFTDEELRR